MRKVHLHGSLSKYGACHEIAVETAGEAVAAICTNFPGAMVDIREGSWVIMRGDPETGMCLSEEAIVGMSLGGADIHIMPEVMGRGGDNGALKIVLGVALIAISFGGAAFLAAPISASLMGATTWGNMIGQLGLAMALSGVSTMLTPETESSSNDMDSFTMTGPVSKYGQGNAMQIAYGELITGGMMISGGMDTNGLDSVVEKPVVNADPVVVASDPNNEADGSGGSP